jgi:TolB-like protein
MSSTRWSVVAAASLALVACAGGSPPATPAPQDLPALEAASQAKPGDADLMTRLGVAYFEAGQYDRARDVLRSSLVIKPGHYSTHVYLGLTYEQLSVFDSARAELVTARGLARDGRQRDEIDGHLNLLTRRELQYAAREAIAQEATLSQQAPRPNTVAVFPFRYTGSNPDLEPLGRGLTHLMITDLAKIGRLTLLEREQVQALVEELALSEGGRVDPATGARSGRLLRASEVIQGAVQEGANQNQIRLDAAVVSATSASVLATGQAADQLQQLFSIQKAVLFRLLEQLQISLTPAEQRALSERPTADLQAFLAFSRGLEAEDRGDFAAAQVEYKAALARDPNFRAASQRASSTQLSLAATTLPPSTLAGFTDPGGVPGGGPATGGTGVVVVSGRGQILNAGVLNTIPTIGSTLTNRISSQTGPVTQQPGTRAPLPEATGSDNAASPGGLIGTIIIIITRP